MSISEDQSDSACFSTITCDLLTFHSFLLNLLIRLSLSSLMGMSSVLEITDALLSTKGSRIDPSDPGLEEVLSDDVDDVEMTEVVDNLRRVDDMM